MSSFWSLWVFVLTLAFVWVLFRLFRHFHTDNGNADFDKVVCEFDGIEERDGSLPRWLLNGFMLCFVCLVLYLALMPGIYRGVIGQSIGDPEQLEGDNQLLDRIASVSAEGPPSLIRLAQEEDIRHAGQKIFETYCGSCHGMQGEGNYSFPNLVDESWIYGALDEELLQSIAYGRNYAMPGYASILTADEIEHVRKYLISLNPERALEATRVEIEQGKTVYEQSSCGICHGGDGRGYAMFGGYNLTDDVWVYGGDMADIRQSITMGRLGEMPAFSELLDEAQIQAVGAYVRYLGQRRQERLSAFDPELIERGRYLAAAGDCVSCHSGQGGEPFGGGLPFATPFGTMYSTNISTSRPHGIGEYSYKDFRSALKKGYARKHFLFPAMPFTSFQHVTDSDIEALWAYLQTRPPVHKPNKPLEMIFPTNIRLGQLGWQLLFMDKEPLEYPDDKSETWKRGKYLSWGLGHCTECHTPRNMIMALKNDEPFQGFLMEGLRAPNITATELYRSGWTVDSLHDFLKLGHSEKGTPFGVMADVVKNSTRYLTDQDVIAIATYLTEGDVNNELDTTIPPIVAAGFPERHKTGNNEGYQLYIRTCGNCHGADGEGLENGAPPLLNNGILTHSNPSNLIAVSLRGLTPSYMTKDSHFQNMSSFETILTDGELSQLLSYVRYRLGGQEEPISRQQVRLVREYLENAGLDAPIAGHSTAEEEAEPPSEMPSLDIDRDLAQ